MCSSVKQLIRKAIYMQNIYADRTKTHPKITSTIPAGCSMVRRELFRIDLELLPSVSVAKNPNNRQERVQKNGNRYNNEKHVRRSEIIGRGGGYVCEGPLKERRDCAM